MFHAFGVRLNEPVDDEVIEVIAEAAGQNPPQNVDAVSIRVFILTHDPPGL